MCGISELYRKIGNYSHERTNRQKIAYQYYNSLKDITVGASFDIENLIGSSDNFSYMIMCKDREHKRNLKKKLLIKNLNVGSQMYPNCSLYDKYSSFNGRSSNLNNLTEKNLILPTHSKLTNEYVQSLIYEIKKNY